MPITSSVDIQPISYEEFQSLDYQVMKHAFASQNEIGRLADERVYQADLAARVAEAGFHVDREVTIKLSHDSFQKQLFLDLVVDRKAIYELKVATALNEKHCSQLITYLYLLNLERGKLVNFATQRVQTEFVNAAMSQLERHTFDIDKSNYCGPASLVNWIADLVRDWGTGLSRDLYSEAVVHFAGGAQQVVTMLPMRRDDIEIGNQRFNLISNNEGFQITTINKRPVDIQSQSQRLLRFSPLTKLHWINIERHRIQFSTIQK